MSRHYEDVLDANARPGPGRGPAPAPGPDRWWWARWTVFDDLLGDALDGLAPQAYASLLAAWPRGWPTYESGHLSIRQMAWMREARIGGRPFDPRARLMHDARADRSPASIMRLSGRQ